MASELQQLHATQESYDRFWDYMKERGVDINNKNVYYEALSWKGLKKTNFYIHNLEDDKKNNLKKYLDAAYQLGSKTWNCK